ncbi:MAG: pseudouridine synthase [Opitutaceae bacterium]
MRRLDQLLSNLGYCSRREADAWLKDGRVTLAGKPARDSSVRCEAQAVRVDGEPLDHPEGLLLMMNKPLGAVCSHDPREGPRVYDLLPERWRHRHPVLATVGRLDRDTTGLLLITDQAPLIHRLTSPKSKLPKLYRARLETEASATRCGAIAAALSSGHLLLEGETEPCRPAEVRWESASEALISVIEGRYRQIRRMFASQGHPLAALHREQLGPLALGFLPAGEWTLLPVDFPFFAG